MHVLFTQRLKVILFSMPYKNIYNNSKWNIYSNANLKTVIFRFFHIFLTHSYVKSMILLCNIHIQCTAYLQVQAHGLRIQALSISGGWRTKKRHGKW